MERIIFHWKFPKSIILTKTSEDQGSKPTANIEYTLISGQFELDKCDKWLTSIQLGSTGFDSKNCTYNENKRIVIKATSETKNPGNGNNNNHWDIFMVVDGHIFLAIGQILRPKKVASI